MSNPSIPFYILAGYDISNCPYEEVPHWYVQKTFPETYLISSKKDYKKSTYLIKQAQEAKVCLWLAFCKLEIVLPNYGNCREIISWLLWYRFPFWKWNSSTKASRRKSFLKLMATASEINSKWDESMNRKPYRSWTMLNAFGVNF